MELIGEGGFGLVFVAEQQEPVCRKVALKVLKPGMDTRQVVARFEAERQALAIMDHPNIARVFDAGSTPNGRPYFVMELIRGIPITDYCDQQKLLAQQRLALFSEVCQATQHAHQRGIIHRDLKPTNVLVAPHDGKPVVKVIDFGVAKALGHSLTEKTIYTQFTQMIGTPLYMSPEQAEVNQLDVDTRSDIYSLGVLLYELLTGTTPLDKERLRTAAFDEIRRIIREEEPPKPSTRLSSLGATLSSVSANRGTEPARLTGLLRGELDWIVMKCLEKDRNRRYESANGLAKDIQCYLDGDAVEACPPTLTYRLRKFYRRNRAAVMTTGLVAVVLVLGTISSTQQAIRATQAEREARAESERAIRAEQAAQQQLDRAQAAEQRAVRGEKNLQAAFGFLWGDVLSQFSPEQNPYGAMKVQTLIDRACDQLNTGPKHPPAIEAMIRGMAGRVYVELGQYSKSRTQLEEALPVLRSKLGADHLETLAAQEALAVALIEQRNAENEIREALRLLTDAWERRKRVQGAGHADTIKCLLARLDAYFFLGEFEEMEMTARRAVETALREEGEDSLVTANAKMRLAGVIMRWGDFTEASDLLKLADTVFQKTLGPDHPQTLASKVREGGLLFFQGRFEEAARHAESIYPRFQHTFGHDHPQTAYAIDAIAVSYLMVHNYDAAKPWINKLLDLNPRI